MESETETVVSKISNMEVWLCNELSKFDINVSTDNARYILSIDSDADVRDYMFELLDHTNPKCTQLVENLIKKKKQPQAQSPSQTVEFPTDITVYKKTSQDDLISPVHIKGKEKQATVPEDDKSISPMKGSAKKKSKFVPLYSEEGQKQAVVKLRGRHPCQCQATKHTLINNCLNCGRVVCDQEGSGPCLFCSNLVCTNEEWDVLSRNSKKSEKLRKFLENLGGGGKVIAQQKKKVEGQEEAVQYKDRLLEYDRTSAKRTQVIDDESDYFSLNSEWLSQEQRVELEARERAIRDRQEASRRKQRVTLDFAGRRVLDDRDDVSVYREAESMMQSSGTRDASSTAAYDRSRANPVPMKTFVPVYIAPEESYSNKVKENSNKVKEERSHGSDDPRVDLRLQDRELREMSDLGACLSMHQPWASLLVAGVKLHEGRTWYTAHRGRLWIASTAKVTPQSEISQIVRSYHYICLEDGVQFPDSYPVSCLLGCVDVTDCMDQDVYRQTYPDGESASPYVMICKNPHCLPIKFPIKGQHKIYKLDKHIHEAAKKGILAT